MGGEVQAMGGHDGRVGGVGALNISLFSTSQRVAVDSYSWM